MNIKYQIIQGGMAWSTDSKLACAVCDAGGLGIIGCGGRDPDWVINEIDKSKKITSHRIGLNVAMNDSNAINIVEIAIANGIKVFTMGGILLLSSISNAKFKKEALPGLELIMSAKIDSFKRGIIKGNIICESKGELVCSSDMTIIIPNAIKQFSNSITKDK